MGKGGGGGVGKDASIAAAKTFWTSQPARKAVFKQLESALRTGGGTGFKSGVVQQGVARSLAAGQQAMRTAGDLTRGMDTNIRSRVINRLSQGIKQQVASAGPSFAGQLISQAPAAFNAAGAGQAGMLSVAAQGEAAAREAAAIRGQGWANAATAIASGAGRGIGSLASAPSSTPPAPGGAPAPAYAPPPNAQGWYQRFFGSGA